MFENLKLFEMFDRINNELNKEKQRVNVCHLCLSTVNNKKCDTVDEKLQDDLNIYFFCDLKKDTVICHNCSKKTLGLSNFIATFVQTQHEINDTIISNGVSKVCLNSVYLKRNCNNPGITLSGQEKICMICLNLINGIFKKFFGGEESILVRYIKKYMSLNLIYIKDPVACEQCYNFLKTLYSFTNNNSYKIELKDNIVNHPHTGSEVNNTNLTEPSTSGITEFKDNIVNLPQPEFQAINVPLTEPSTSGITLSVKKDLFEKENFKTDTLTEEVQIGTVKMDPTAPNLFEDIVIKPEPVDESVNVTVDKNERKRKLPENITSSSDSDSEPETSPTRKVEKKTKLDQILNDSGDKGLEHMSQSFKADIREAVKGLQTLIPGVFTITNRRESTSSRSSDLDSIGISQKCLTTAERVSNITKHYSDTFKRINRSKEKCIEKVRELDRELDVYKRKLKLIDEVELRIQARFKSRITEAIKDLDSADTE